MSDFRHQVDGFLAAPKEVEGVPTWRPGRDIGTLSAWWFIGTPGGISDHRLHIAADPTTPWRGYSVMVEFMWGGRQIPVCRLTADDELHIHDNHPPLPPGIEPTAEGTRIYLWDDNRHAFKPTEMSGLPYGRSFAPQTIALESGIRHLCALTRIDLRMAELPDYPSRGGLF
jgi:hypothetical protein